MSDQQSSTDSSDELSGILRTAVEELKREPIPEAAMQQALDRAEQRAIPAARTNRRLRRTAVLGLAGAVAACIVLVVWYSRPTNLWAQVVRAVQTKPWIHAVSRQDGKVFFESWRPMSGTVFGRRADRAITFVDERSQVAFDYDEERKLLYRRRASDLDQSVLGLPVEFFQGMFRGDEKLKWPSPDTIVKEQYRRQIKRDGRDWDELELVLHDPRQPKLQTWKILVDPRTHLPRSMSSEPFRVTIDIDYPDSGPADIYGLGVPKNAKLVDCIPTGEVARIIATIKAERDRFDDFHAIVVEDRGWEPIRQEHRTTYLVWKKGTRWRIEEDDGFPKNIPDAASEDNGPWLREQCAKGKFSQYYICDGNRFYKGDDFDLIGAADSDGIWGIPGGPFTSQPMPAFWAYPPEYFAPDADLQLQLTNNPSGGPAGSVVLSVPGTGWNIAFQRFWLDPKRNFALVRSDRLESGPAKTSASPEGFRDRMDSWKQTPKGVWYPTRVSRTLGTEPPKEGNMKKGFHFFLEFGTEMPDSLFKPEKRTVFLDRYPVK